MFIASKYEDVYPLKMKMVYEKIAHKKLPIFMLTTESTPDLKAMGKAAGVLVWIVKPFDAEKLIIVANKVLNKAS